MGWWWSRPVLGFSFSQAEQYDEHFYYRLLGQPVPSCLDNNKESHLDSQAHLTIPNIAPSSTCSCHTHNTAGHIHYTVSHNHHSVGHTHHTAGHTHHTICHTHHALDHTHHTTGHTHHTTGHTHHTTGHTHHTAIHCRSHRGMWEVRTVSEGGGETAGMKIPDTRYFDTDT